MTNVKELIDGVAADVNDIMAKDFTFTHTSDVPQVDDSNLTYESGQNKRGEEINTCVLFVDIRNSVALNSESKTKTMGRIYTAFTKSVISAAEKFGGQVRNIIGDRVMVVFSPEDCYRKAVYCAITINHIASMINDKFDNFEFKCGIGVDYGRISVMKVGVQKKGSENDDNKGLVWVGYPANFASRLTDYANKEFTDTYYKVDGEFYEFYLFESHNPLLGFRKTGYYRKTQKYTAEKFVEDLKVSQSSHNLELLSCRKIYSIEKEEEKYTYKPILLSDKVFQEYAKADSEANDIKDGKWLKQPRKIKDIDFDVWGRDIKWNLG